MIPPIVPIYNTPHEYLLKDLSEDNSTIYADIRSKSDIEQEIQNVESNITFYNEKKISEYENLVKKQLLEGVKKLEAAGCDLIIIACNTVHVYFEEMQAAVKVPIFNIVEETKKNVIKFGYKKVGIFASESTNKLQLYQRKFAESNILVISPNYNQQKILNKVIEHVMGGNQKQEDIIILKEIARDYLKQGAEAIILGCTEIPLAINQTHTDLKLFDTIEIIVQSAVDYSLIK